jgi:hypothetical protein
MENLKIHPLEEDYQEAIELLEKLGARRIGSYTYAHTISQYLLVDERKMISPVSYGIFHGSPKKQVTIGELREMVAAKETQSEQERVENQMAAAGQMVGTMIDLVKEIKKGRNDYYSGKKAHYLHITHHSTIYETDPTEITYEELQAWYTRWERALAGKTMVEKVHIKGNRRYFPRRWLINMSVEVVEVG